MEPSFNALTTELGLDPEIYRNPTSFIATVRTGISGQILKRALENPGGEEIFRQALGTDASGFESYCRTPRLDRGKSEIILDTIRVWVRVRQIWEVDRLALDWLHSSVRSLSGARPVELFDTHEGRRWVAQVAEKIEHGEFS